MAHSRPTEIDDFGSAWRITTAAGALIVELTIDPRVECHYPQWRRAREEAYKRLAHLKVTSGLDDAATERLFNAYAASEAEATERLLAQQLPELPAEWRFWVARSLVEAFLVRWHNEQHPDEPERQFYIPVEMLPDAPSGRKPRNDGDDIVRNVGWFYRTRIKQPADSVHGIAREYAPTAMRGDADCRSVVQNGIQQALALLDLVAKNISIERATPTTRH